MASWSPKGKSVIGTTLLDGGGNPTDDRGAFKALKSHWEPVFNNTVGDCRALNRFSRFVQKCPEGIEPPRKGGVSQYMWCREKVRSWA